MIGFGSGWKALFQASLPPLVLPSRYGGDQDWIIDVYLNTSGLGGLMGYDSNCEIFQVTCRVSPIPTSPDCPLSQDSVWFEAGRITNYVTNTQPSVVHLVGPAHWPFKYYLENMLPYSSHRVASCHYFEVAAAMFPTIKNMERTATWSGLPYA